MYGLHVADTTVSLISRRNVSVQTFQLQSQMQHHGCQPPPWCSRAQIPPRAMLSRACRAATGTTSNCNPLINRSMAERRTRNLRSKPPLTGPVLPTAGTETRSSSSNKLRTLAKAPARTARARYCAYVAARTIAVPAAHRGELLQPTTHDSVEVHLNVCSGRTGGRLVAVRVHSCKRFSTVSGVADGRAAYGI